MGTLDKWRLYGILFVVGRFGYGQGQVPVPAPLAGIEFGRAQGPAPTEKRIWRAYFPPCVACGLAAIVERRADTGATVWS